MGPNRPGTVISIVSTIDRDYRVPFEVLASSLLRAKQAATAVEWHVFTDGGGRGWEEWLEGLNAAHRGRRGSFVLHRALELPAAGLPLRGHARPIMYARILAPAFLAARVPRALYLDADAIVLRPVEELWETDLGRATCACCQDLAVPVVSSGMAIRRYRELGLPPDAPFFNAGVMLIDTARWVGRKVAEKALDYLDRHAEMVNLFDQEALNAALHADWHRGSCRWNLIAGVAGRPFLDVRFVDRDDYAASLDAPGILHFAGALKPWLNPCLRGRWYEHYREAVRQARPDHRFEPRLKHRLQAAYDAWLRNWAYPVERAAWQARRGSWTRGRTRTQAGADRGRSGR